VMQQQAFIFGGAPAEHRSFGSGRHSQPPPPSSPLRHMAAPPPVVSLHSIKPQQTDLSDALSTARRSTGCRDQDRPQRAFVAGPRQDAEASSIPVVRNRDQQQHRQQVPHSSSPESADQRQDQKQPARHKREHDGSSEAQPAGKRARLSLASLAAALPCPQRLSQYSNNLRSPSSNTSPLMLPRWAAHKASVAASGKRSRWGAFERPAPAISLCPTMGASTGSSPKRLRF
jgi:hypothetical protein